VPPVAGIGTLTAFQWDAERKESTPAPGDAYANYTFWFTNVSSKEVIIQAVRTSCGCTLARLPATPWPVPPGTNGPIEVALDLRGKMGAITKAITVESSDGSKTLFIQANLPPPGAPVPGATPPGHPPMADTERLANMAKALADRQVVFRDAACAKCHADPARNLADGRAIYGAVCATCHDSALRAEAVPDLRTLKHETDLDYWLHWIRHGKPGSMMPSFAQSAGLGGPLSDAQVAALAAHCQATFQPGTAGRAAAVPFLPTATNPSPAAAGAISVFPLPPTPAPKTGPR
jgi:mono/diheme cytochrome c family protein